MCVSRTSNMVGMGLLLHCCVFLFLNRIRLSFVDALMNWRCNRSYCAFADLSDQSGLTLHLSQRLIPVFLLVCSRMTWLRIIRVYSGFHFRVLWDFSYLTNGGWKEWFVLYPVSGWFSSDGLFLLHWNQLSVLTALYPRMRKMDRFFSRGNWIFILSWLPDFSN